MYHIICYLFNSTFSEFGGVHKTGCFHQNNDSIALLGCKLQFFSHMCVVSLHVNIRGGAYGGMLLLSHDLLHKSFCCKVPFRCIVSSTPKITNQYARISPTCRSIERGFFSFSYAIFIFKLPSLFYFAIEKA